MGSETSSDDLKRGNKKEMEEIMKEHEPKQWD